MYKTKLNIKNILKYKEHPLAARYLKELDALCDSFRGTAIEATTFSQQRMCDVMGDRATFEGIYFKNRRRLTAFYLRTALYGEQADLEELHNIMWAVCNEFNWAFPAHTYRFFVGGDVSEHVVDLFACETAHTLAEILSVLGDKIDPVIQRLVRERIEQRVFLPFESGEKEKYRLIWEDLLENWAAVCGGALGMAAIYLIEDEKRLNKILKRCIHSVNMYIKSCTDDGVCLEGVVYWNYAMCYYVAFDALLKEKTGKSAVADFEKVKKVAAFPGAVCIGNGLGVGFSDTSAKPAIQCGISTKLCKDYGVRMLGQEYCGPLMHNSSRTADCARTLAWFDPSVFTEKAIPENRFYSEAQWAIWYVKDAVLAIKGGHNDEPHNHNDIGAYQLVYDGMTVVEDLGAPLYDKDYFLTETRYNYLNTSSRGHAVPIVNDCLQKNGASYKADGFVKTEGGASVSFAGAYPAEADVVSLVRTVRLDEDAHLSVSDSFAFSKKGNAVKERIVTKLNAVEQGKKIILQKDGVTLFEIIPCEKCETVKIDTATYRNHRNEEQGIAVVTLIDLEYQTATEQLQCAYTIKRI